MKHKSQPIVVINKSVLVDAR